MSTLNRLVNCVGKRQRSKSNCTGCYNFGVKIVINTETQDVQNRLARLEMEVYLNVTKPDVKLKRQYHKAVKALADARHEFDILNDMKEEL